MKQLLFATILFLSAFNHLQAQNEQQISPANNASITDMEFIIQAYELGLDVAMFANLAKTQGSSVTIQDFGKMIELHHNEINNELQLIADKNNVALPTQLPIEILNQHEAMKIKQGAEFDNAYIDKMIVDHQNLISLFQNKIGNVQNEDIQSWAQRVLPKLKQHLDELAKLKSTP